MAAVVGADEVDDMFVARRLALLVVALSCAGGVLAQAATAPSASQLMHTALSDADARGSVHESESETSPSLTASLSSDIAAHEGRQDITRSGGEQAHVLIVGAVAYVSGNQAALVHYFGFPAAVAREVGSRWVAIPSSSSDYTTIAADATLSSAIASLSIPGHLTETKPTEVGGQAVVGIRGDVPIPGSPHTSVAVTLYVSRTSRPLPVAATYTYSKGGRATITLSAWGEAVALSAPTNVVPASKLS